MLCMLQILIAYHLYNHLSTMEYLVKFQQDYLFLDKKIHHFYIIYKQNNNDWIYKKHCLLLIH
jgi:hypothetical protein